LPGSITLQNGQHYGQFTRQSSPQNGGELWIFPPDQTVISFDALKTQDVGGTDPTSSAQATFVVGVPEPGAVSLALLGTVGMMALRRRRD
jgi:hypothetical protein